MKTIGIYKAIPLTMDMHYWTSTSNTNGNYYMAISGGYVRCDLNHSDFINLYYQVRPFLNV